MKNDDSPRDVHSFTESYIYQNIIELQNIFLEIHSRENTYYKVLMEFDEKRYDNLIENIKEKYIHNTNLLYKLYDVSPKAWGDRYSVHNFILDYFKLNKSEFLTD